MVMEENCATVIEKRSRGLYLYCTDKHCLSPLTSE